MAATVYIIRHAEAEGNIYRRCHGLYDSLLTPRAYQQLPCLAKRFESVPLAAVYASPLFRARTTAQAVAAPHGLTVELRNALHEIDMGDWEDLRGPSCRTAGLTSTQNGAPVRGRLRRRTARPSCRQAHAC